jgi:hypothetical protein
MVMIEILLELGLKQVQLPGVGPRSGLHAVLKLQGNGAKLTTSLQF